MPLLCLVPTALRASRVTRRLCDAQGGVLLGRQAITFDSLAAALVAASGNRRPVLGPLGERLLAAEAGRAAGGRLAALSPADGLTASLHSALTELRRGEVTAGDALAAARTLEGAPRARLEALAAALDAWERALEERGLLDRAGALRAAATASRRRITVPETEAVSLLLLDGFTSLAPAEWELFGAVAARAGAVRVHLPHFSDYPAATAAAEPLARKLESLHELASERAFDVHLDLAGDPARAPQLSALLVAMAGGEPPAATGEGAVRAISANGDAAEARAVAAVAASWIEAGMAPGEVRVVSPSPGSDAGRLARAFAELGIPFAAGRGPPLADVPVVRLLREALGAAGGLTRRAAERLGRSSYLSLGEPADRLGTLLDRSGAIDGRSPPAEALRRRAESLGAGGGRERAGLGRAAGRLDALRALLAPLDAPGTARRHAARLASFVDAAGIRRRAARAAPALAARDLAAIARVLDAADEVARSLAHLGRADAALSRGEWLAALDAALGAATLAPAYEPFGGAAELLGLEDAPGEAARGVILVGCSRARFPPSAPPEPLLREPDRQALCAHLRRQAVATSAGRRADGRHRALCAAAVGREAIAFTWRADDGPVAPLVETGLAAAGVRAPVAASGGDGTPRSPRDVLRAAARRSGSAGAASAPGAGLGDRVESALARGRIEAERRAALDGREPSPFAGAVPPAELAATLPAEWTPTQLEEYARCPYRLFLSLGAGLPRREGTGVDIDQRDEGSLLHAALEQFVRARVARGAWPPSGGEEDREEALAVAEETFAAFERAGRTGDPAVWGARRQAVRARLVRWVEAEARDADGCVPRLLEHRFGGDSGRPPLRFGEGAAAVEVQGRIDRVDADGRRLLLLDYKNSRATKVREALLDPEAFGVTSFQIPVYLAAAARELPGREVLGATLALLRDAERMEPFTGTSPELFAGPLGPQLEGAIVQEVGKIRAGRFPIVSRGCEHCDYGAVCRFQGVAEVEEGEG